MPIYEYECGLCHFKFEKKQRFDAKPLTICPKCQGEVRRVLHPTPIIFKGSGFYITDNRKGGGSEKAEEGMPDKGKQKGK
ncbi:hypothetical protein ES703_57150 [subsurface metagenome]